jgi:hypothetical protein
LKIKQYKIGAAMPEIALGLIPTLIAMLIGHAWLLCFGIFFTAAAGGDMLVLWKLKPYDKDDEVKDHPEKIGFIIKNHINN